MLLISRAEYESIWVIFNPWLKSIWVKGLTTKKYRFKVVKLTLIFNKININKIVMTFL